MSVLGFIKHRVIAGVRDEGGVVPAARKAMGLLANGGLRTLVLGDAYVPGVSYTQWIEELERLQAEDRERIARDIDGFSEPPKISVLVPTLRSAWPMRTRPC